MKYFREKPDYLLQHNPYDLGENFTGKIIIFFEILKMDRHQVKTVGQMFQYIIAKKLSVTFPTRMHCIWDLLEEFDYFLCDEQDILNIVVERYFKNKKKTKSNTYSQCVAVAVSYLYLNRVLMLHISGLITCKKMQTCFKVKFN